MVSKRMLRIDIIGQIVITTLTIFSIIAEPNRFLISGMIFLLFIGLWQLGIGFLEVIVYKNETRKQYLIAAFVFIASMIFLGGINSWFTVGLDNEIFTNLIWIYISAGSMIFASWYFRQTILDLNQPEITRTFWDLEF